MKPSFFGTVLRGKGGCDVKINYNELNERFDAVADLIDDAAKRTKKCILAAKDEIKRDIAAVRERDPAARSDIEVALLYSGFHAVIAHRAAHALHKKGHTLAARAISQTAKLITGIEIHPGATIGKNFFIDHGAGVVIGETAEIGDNCTLYQGVTLGGTGKDTGKRHPTLGNNVMVGCGAKVLGPFKIGDNSKIAANAVVLNEIPADSTAVGIPAKVVKTAGKRINEELDQIHVPDPVANEISALKARVEELEKILMVFTDLDAPSSCGNSDDEHPHTVNVDGVGEIDLNDPVIREIFGSDDEK